MSEENKEVLADTFFAMDVYKIQYCKAFQGMFTVQIRKYMIQFFMKGVILLTMIDFKKQSRYNVYNNQKHRPPVEKENR